jgi:hypothetical protein
MRRRGGAERKGTERRGVALRRKGRVPRSGVEAKWGPASEPGTKRRVGMFFILQR